MSLLPGQLLKNRLVVANNKRCCNQLLRSILAQNRPNFGPRPFALVKMASFEAIFTKAKGLEAKKARFCAKQDPFCDFAFLEALCEAKPFSKIGAFLP